MNKSIRSRRDPPDINSLARSFAPMSIRKLAGIVQNSTNDSARVAAANSILDRAYGKAEQSTSLNAEIQITIRKLFEHSEADLVDVTPPQKLPEVEDKSK